MTDHDLERLLREGYRSRRLAAPPTLRMEVAAIPDLVPAAESVPHVSRIVAVALAAAAAVTIVIAVGILTVAAPEAPVGPGPQETQSPEETRSPVASTAASSPAALPWPGRRATPAGGVFEDPERRYFWDMGVARWMTNGQVSIRMGTFADPPTGAGTATTVAGFPASVEDKRDGSGDVLVRTWIVDIQGTRVFIIVYGGTDLTAGDGTPLTTDQLAEVEAIVESIRRERDPDGAGFRLTFTLGGGWSSG